MFLAESGRPDNLTQRRNWGISIAAAGGDVLPRLPPAAIADALRRLPQEELDLALRSKILPVVALPGLKLFATFGEAARAAAARDGLKVVAEGRAADFIAAAREALGATLVREATLGLARRLPRYSAAKRLSSGQWAALWSLLAALIAAGLSLPAHAFLLALSLPGGLFFLAIIALRVLCLLPQQRQPRRHGMSLSDEALPAYSVLVPLYRETSVLGQLLQGLVCLDYPAEKLDIKLILEESDILMQRAVAGLRLPPQFEVIVVPPGLPQTKPRALNYALQFASGDLVTIFDAEDIPEPLQLRLAAEHFAALPETVACLQAQLVFYNPNENWLTRQFTAEYAGLFGVMLPALAASGLPFPLGGTSNHFRAEILRRIGAWDPFNVTEDADLGLRLARAGYSAATINSLTYEEANTELGNWLNQRARWFKGFLQTWLVHTREPGRFLREVGPAAFWATQTMTIGVFGSALLHPLCLAVMLGYFAFGAPLAADAGEGAVILAGLNLLVLLAGYGAAILTAKRGLARLHYHGWGFTLASLPLYWLLMSLAAWMALWQFITAPFYWNKTRHGLSVFQRRRK